ncbi:MAG: aminotransferase class III-fold pyridoxal phosphate-dependent enzyme [Candidatus Lokiarchaeota archaeon]|nr:aminotransferase class III-fold pyridoxal phosphate-dependent enzyme [Candidatus Lokiarchaeota archaeon]
MFIKEELEKFQKDRPKSERLWQKALDVLPGGVSHNIRTFGLPLIGSFPVFIKSSNGAYLKDIDNNEYIDCWNGHFAMILGHNPPEVRNEIKKYLVEGWHFGTNTEYQVGLAETIIQRNPGIEKIRFCVSGTEATMYASRLARAFTKKRLVAKARLGWHGANDTLLYDIGSLKRDQVSPGLLKAEQAGILSFQINDESAFDLIKENSHDLAAIIIEPVLGGGGGFPVDLEFLKRLKEDCEKYGILLIFDEIITGYRFVDSFFQNEVGVIPDLTTMGKIIGGGMPIGGIGGRKDIIDRSSPDAENQVLIGGGTFSGYPLSMIAGLKTLEILKGSPHNYERINKEGESLLNNLNRFFKEEKSQINAVGHKSMIMLHALSKWIENPSMEEIFKFKDKKREALLQLALFNRDISGLHGLGSISMAHTHENLLKIQETVKEISQPVSQSKFK